jgi:hypothetical protein
VGSPERPNPVSVRSTLALLLPTAPAKTGYGPNQRSTTLARSLRRQVNGPLS